MRFTGISSDDEHQSEINQHSDEGAEGPPPDSPVDAFLQAIQAIHKPDAVAEAERLSDLRRRIRDIALELYHMELDLQVEHHRLAPGCSRLYDWRVDLS